MTCCTLCTDKDAALCEPYDVLSVHHAVQTASHIHHTETLGCDAGAYVH